MKFGKSRPEDKSPGASARFAVGGWPKGVPQLYPDLSDRELSRFIDDDEFQRILALPKLIICPLYSLDDEEEAAALGSGLSLLLIRDLMLIRNLSVLGPEDTPELPLEEIEGLRERHPQAIHVSGSTTKSGMDVRVELQVFHPGRDAVCREITGSSVVPLVKSCATAIAELAEGEVNSETQQMWRYGRPRSFQGLIDLGALHLGLDPQDPQRSEYAIELAEANRDFVLPLHELDSDDVPDVRRRMLDGLERDPYDAQLHFLTALNFWESRGPQPEMVQYIRRCIELSPGHGKAHMCAPHAAHPEVDMLRHSELGYRLLPGNTFAVNNYLIYLQQAGRPAEELVALAAEGIQNDPYDPGNYERLIQLCIDLDDLESALKTAERLQQLYEPEIDERTLYCLQQNPAMAQMLKAGEANPAGWNRKRIEELKHRLAKPPPGAAEPSAPFVEPPRTNIAANYRARVEREDRRQGQGNPALRTIAIMGLIISILLLLIRLMS